MNFPNIAALALGALVASTAFAGSKTEARTVEPFTKLSVGGGLEVKVVPGAPGYTVEAEGEQLGWVKHVVKDGRLTIHVEPPALRMTTGSFKVTVRGAPLSAIEASGGVKLSVEAPTQATFALAVSGGVAVQAKQLALNTFAVSANGGAELQLAGKTGTLTAEASGGVVLDASKLEAQSATLEASGGCTVTVRAKTQVDAQGSGAARIVVLGPAKRGAVETSGASSVRFESGG
jgi:Putative auto-transporter adhesin, head GIN domain